MTIKAIELDHVTNHRDGTSTNVLLSAYRKKGAFKVSKGPNTVQDEIPLNTLDEVATYVAKGYLVRMRSEIMSVRGRRGRIEGLYGSSGVRIVR